MKFGISLGESWGILGIWDVMGDEHGWNMLKPSGDLIIAMENNGKYLNIPCSLMIGPSKGWWFAKETQGPRICPDGRTLLTVIPQKSRAKQEETTEKKDRKPLDTTIPSNFRVGHVCLDHVKTWNAINSNYDVGSIVVIFVGSLKTLSIPASQWGPGKLANVFSKALLHPLPLWALDLVARLLLKSSAAAHGLWAAVGTVGIRTPPVKPETKTGKQREMAELRVFATKIYDHHL